jgi:hypothetical protein
MAAGRPTHRFFQFSITSMLLVTTLVAIWLAWELAFIRERQAWIRDNAALLESDPSAQRVVAHIPWWRMLLGDEAVATLEESDEWSEDERDYVVRLFPEATLQKTIIYSLPVTGTLSTIDGSDPFAISLQKLQSAPTK